jgi:hypothetical protein
MRAASEVEQMLAMQISAEVAAESGNPEILRELGVHARRIADTTASSETRALAQLTRGYCFLAVDTRLLLPGRKAVGEGGGGVEGLPLRYP